MNKDDARAVGRHFERFAARRLKKEGLRVCGRNLRFGRDEIDLLALDGDALVFVEVKARRETDTALLPEQALDTRKCRALTRAAMACLGDLDRKGIDTDGLRLRFDVVAITFRPDTLAVTSYTHHRQYLEPNDDRLFRPNL